MMTAKIIAAILTVLFNIAIGVLIFFFMLVVMNGFHERDAEKGLIVYIALALAVTLLMGTAAYLATHFLMKKKLGGAVAGLISVPVFTLIGGGLKFVSCIVGIAIADHVRVHY